MKSPRLIIVKQEECFWCLQNSRLERPIMKM